MRVATFLATLAACALLGHLSADAGPMVHHLESVLPRCGQRGTTVEVTLRGVSLHDPREIVFYRPGIRAVEFEELPHTSPPLSLYHRGYIEDNVRCKFVIEPDCPLGEHPFRLRTATELTGLCTFHVTRYPVVDEAEARQGDNDSPAKAQPITMNATVRGRIDTNRVPDVDVYRVSGKAGQHLSVEVDAVWLTEKHYAELEFDLAVRLLDARGRELARNDDSALHIQDPIVSVVLPADGEYFVEIRQRIERGGLFVYYAAHVGDNARPLAVFPAGGQAGQPLDAVLLGDSAGKATTQIKLPREPGDFAFDSALPSPLPMRVCEYGNVLESAAADETPVAQLPAALNGVVEPAGDRDAFRLSVKQGERYRVRVFARSLGTPLDPRIWITRVGKMPSEEIAPEIEADDSTYPDRDLYAVGRQLQRKELLDPSIIWEPRETGQYLLQMADMRSLGGPTFVYRVEIEPVRDAVFTYPYSRVIDNVECPRLTNFTIPQGGRWTVNVGLAEGAGNRYRGELELLAGGLPPGVRMIAPRVPAGETIVPVQFVAEGNTPPQTALFALQARAVNSTRELASGSQQAFPFLGHSGGAAWRSVIVDQYALAVTEPAPFSIDVEQPQIPLSLNGELALQIKIARRPGFDEPIEFQADWLPPGVNAEPTVTVVPGQTQAMFRLSATGSAKPGTRKVAVTATTTGGSYYLGVGRIRVSSAFVDIQIVEPYVTLKSKPASIRRGEHAQIVWEVTQKKPLDGEAEVVLLGLPKGVTAAAPAHLKTGDSQLRFEIIAGDEVLLGQYKELTCEIVVRRSGQTIRQRTGAGVLRVDPSLARDAGKKAS